MDIKYHLYMVSINVNKNEERSFGGSIEKYVIATSPEAAAREIEEHIINAEKSDIQTLNVRLLQTNVAEKSNNGFVSIARLEKVTIDYENYRVVKASDEPKI